MKRSHSEELSFRIFFRAVSETKDLNKANTIVMGDTLGSNLDEQINNAMKIYNLKMSECLKLNNFILGITKQL